MFSNWKGSKPAGGPLSLASSFTFFSVSERDSDTCESIEASSLCLSCRISCLISNSSCTASEGYSLDWCRIYLTRGVVTLTEVRNCVTASRTGLMMPRPPILAGRARRSHISLHNTSPLCNPSTSNNLSTCFQRLPVHGSTFHFWSWIPLY